MKNCLPTRGYRLLKTARNPSKAWKGTEIVEKKIYGYRFSGLPHDGWLLECPIGLPDGACIDAYGIIWHSHTGGIRPYAYIFTVEDGDWTEPLGTVGRMLDEQESGNLPEPIRAAFSDVYNALLSLCA